MNKKIIITAFVLIFAFALKTQSQGNKMYIPRDIKAAYEKGTRSYQGVPGEHYFQNHANYTIDVDFDPETRLVKGKETIQYANNSPNKLKHIVLRLYQEIYKKGGMRNFEAIPEEITDGVKISRLVIDNTLINLEDKETKMRKDGTNLILALPEQFEAGSSHILEIEWSYTLNIQPKRTGKFDESSYFIGYWYPRISVYDDVHGWDVNNFLGMAEFYNDFGNYDVNITVPANFIVWATGTLQNAGEVLQKKYFSRYQKAHQSDEVIHIIDSTEIYDQNITVQNEKNTWHFKAEQVPDFAFGTSDHYLWDAVSTIAGDKRVFIDVAYKKESKDFYEVAEISKSTIELLSEKTIGIPYPFPALSVFNGTFGMEFPMIMNDGSYPTRHETVFVTSHEITHSYIPFLAGSNERKYAWMDEGLVTFIPKDIEIELEPSVNPYKRLVRGFERWAGREVEMPLMVPTFLLNGTTYWVHSYSRSGAAMYCLSKMLGRDVFDEVFREFINRWKYKHPLPYDYFFTAEDVTGEDLSWFWKPWFFEMGYPDLALEKAIQKDGEVEVTVTKNGAIPTTLKLTYILDDGEEKTIEHNTRVWSKGDQKITLTEKINKPVKQVILGDELIPDSDRTNNSISL